ncbi:MAG: ArnT family glycosyltransferase [Blastocatellia bacterium]
MVRRERVYAGVMAVVMAYHLATLGIHPAMPTDDDGAYAAAAYQMWQTGRPGVPGYRSVVGMGEDIFLLGHLGGWIQGAGMALTGVGLRAALVPSWVVGILLLWMVFRLGQQLWGREAAWLATLLLSLSGVFFQATHSARPDLLVALFLVTAMGVVGGSARPGIRLLSAGLLMGFSGDLHPNGFLLTPVPFVFWWWRARPGWRDLGRAVLLYGLGTAVGVGYWVIRHYLPNPEGFWRQNGLHGIATHGIPLLDWGLGGALRSEAQRYLDWFWEARGHRHLGEGVLVLAAAAWHLSRGERSGRALVIAWATLFLIGALAMSNTFSWYLIFAWPFFALWTAAAIVQLARAARFRRVALLAWGLLLVGALGNHQLWGWKASQAVPLTQRIPQIRLIVPPDAPVFASAGLWFAFWDRDFTHEPYLPFRALETTLYPETGPTGWEVESRRLGWRYVAAYGNLQRFLDPEVPLHEILATPPWRDRAEEVRQAREWSLHSLEPLAKLPSPEQPILLFRVIPEGEKGGTSAGPKKMVPHLGTLE